MNEETRFTLQNYVLLVKTVHGDPSEKVTITIKGSEGQTEKLYLGKSQSYAKAFKENQTDVFLLSSQIHIGKICQVQFDAAINHKTKEWKYKQITLIHGTRVYHGGSFEYSLLSSLHTPSITNLMEPSKELQENVYYALIKTGYDGCSKDCYPKLSLYGTQEHKYSMIDLKTLDSTRSSSSNNTHSLEKGQLDLYQWQDQDIGHIERMQLSAIAKHKTSKSSWQIEWILVIHHGYTFTGRIMLNRIIKPDRVIDINLEQKSSTIHVHPTNNDQGDSILIEKKNQQSYVYPMDLLNKQFNASADDDIGRYYVIIRNVDGTSGDVYIEFHGDHLGASGEQHLLRCENYPDHPFASKHADLYHIKALEVGHIESVTLRLDQKMKEHSLTLESLFIFHNAVMYHFDLHDVMLNKSQPKEKFYPMTQPEVPSGKSGYYIATHTSDKLLSGTNSTFKVTVNGTRGTFGPVILKESLTNGMNPFERECIDIFYFEEQDIGEPTSISVVLEPKGLLPHLFSSARCERLMLVKAGEYNSLWQLVGDLKAKEAKFIPLPVRGRASIKDAHPAIPKPTAVSSHPSTPVHGDELIRSNVVKQMATALMIEKSASVKMEHSTPRIENKGLMKIESDVGRKTSPAGDSRANHLTIADIEDHQKRHTFASTLSEAERNYRELRRLLRKMNGPAVRERKTPMKKVKSSTSTKITSKK